MILIMDNNPHARKYVLSYKRRRKELRSPEGVVIQVLGLLHNMAEAQEVVDSTIRLRETKKSASQPFTLEAQVQRPSLSKSLHGNTF